jgi:multicomponent Na+:H+ antiporter subunit A
VPPIALLAPIVLPIVAAVVAAATSRFGEAIARVVAAAGAWAALAAVAVLWLTVRSTQELSLGPLGFGVGLDLRLDGVAVVFGVIALVPAALLLTLQARGWQESTVALLAIAAVVLAIESGNMVLTAIGGCTAATLAVVQFDIEDVRAVRPSWASVMIPWIALAWAGVTLQIQAGTAAYAAVPVSALTTQIFALIAIAALLSAGIVPWRGWAVRIWMRPSLRAASVTAATLLPLGLYLLVRAYELGNGRYPQSWLNLALATWGVLVALGAAARAQAAPTRSEYMAETVPGLAGFALMSIAIGTAVGLFAGLILLASAALLIAALPLLPDRRGPAALLVAAAAAGIPPGLAFGGRVLGLADAFEAGNAFGLVAVAGAATWLVAAAGAARSVGLHAGRRRQASDALALVAGVLGVIVLAAGPAIAGVASITSDAIAGIMPLPTGGLAPDALSIITVSTTLPALALFGPLLLLGAAAVVLSKPGPVTSAAQSKAPLFDVPGAAAAMRLRDRLRSWTIPEQYRSLFDLAALERLAAGGRPALWLASLVALAFAVSR